MRVERLALPAITLDLTHFTQHFPSVVCVCVDDSQLFSVLCTVFEARAYGEIVMKYSRTL